MVHVLNADAADHGTRAQRIVVQVVKTVGGALLVVLVLACGVAAAIAPYLSPLAWKVRPCSAPCALRTTPPRRLRRAFFARDAAGPRLVCCRRW